MICKIPSGLGSLFSSGDWMTGSSDVHRLEQTVNGRAEKFDRVEWDVN